MKISKACIAFFLSLLIFPVAYGKDMKTLTVINHFDRPINWLISINPDVLPGFPQEFTLAPFSEIKTEVVDLHKPSYLSGIDDQKNTAFWSIELVGNQLSFHGYVSHGIAYSWTSDTITFCTPQEYGKNGHC